MTEPLPIVTRVATLHRVDLFANIPGRLLVAVAAASDEVRVDAGSTIIEEGAVEDHLFVVVAGRVRVHRGDTTLVELGPGAIVGELAVLVPEPRSATVSALEPTLLLTVRKPVLDELLLDWPELANGVIASLVAKLRAAAAQTAHHDGG
ncbi:MAG: cyclic nucleotide-binding domain-containing protein [Ilumatobacteraceae bacterium]